MCSIHQGKGADALQLNFTVFTPCYLDDGVGHHGEYGSLNFGRAIGLAVMTMSSALVAS